MCFTYGGLRSVKMNRPILTIGGLGTKYWYFNGILHREDGPAVEWLNGDKEWYINGYRHRVDGPAKEWSYGKKEYWYNGERLDITTDAELRVLIKTGFTLL